MASRPPNGIRPVTSGKKASPTVRSSVAGTVGPDRSVLDGPESLPSPEWHHAAEDPPPTFRVRVFIRLPSSTPITCSDPGLRHHLPRPVSTDAVAIGESV